ncbi:CTD kinase subunit gamma CTK3-domain-containing protein [Kockiozyma suomiensis]|uniref:CTD kinase subunit gamma CTK3-domain-containing protein n=1 Tax=Kockiozyma suomiensis TaxID=1337062 RepID=UPI003343F33C
MPLDAFEARLAFTDLLRRLNASVQSATKCAQFAIRYKDLSEDLYSCIVEELELTSLNSRVNILYFLEILGENSIRIGFPDYVDMIRRDLWELLDKVVPVLPGALANIALARKAIDNLQRKTIITEEELHRVTKRLEEREAQISKDEISSFSRGDILKRMDEDRERHKRMRENIWVIPQGDAIQVEFENAWETTSDLGEDDYDSMKEENNLLKQYVLK